MRSPTVQWSIKIIKVLVVMRGWPKIPNVGHFDVIVGLKVKYVTIKLLLSRSSILLFPTFYPLLSLIFTKIKILKIHNEMN